MFYSLDCLPGWILFQSSCYLLLEKNLKNWYNAEIDCVNRNADLLYIISAEEEEFIDSQLVNTSIVKVVFIGLIDSNSSERFPNWSSGDNLTYTNWYNAPAVIDQEAACVVKDYMLNGRWTTVRCLQVLPYICKRKGMTGGLKTGLPFPHRFLLP